ncbi:serine/threonine kinase family protein [Plesiocystis pacifica SIR-1]|uniref:Serine/threonine kinase family protein n=1 Tax=Plesiocystis pacifica SIR-1 TaxID=391625 RepID=A6FXC9_9BACT|nr:serine/threonine kinase family protein [Plesiocystis pacifica SIR-1]
MPGALEGSGPSLRSAPQAGEGDTPRPGTVIDRYVVLAFLGAGAMGLVLAAYDPELDRRIALKLLKTPRWLDEPGRNARAQVRLRREAQALARLGHPNVVTIYDVGVHEGQLYIAMEFVAGQTLGAWMAGAGEGQRRPWAEVSKVFEAAGRGLAAAHGAGLIHRDFKPENVMIGEDGRVRVMDFGLARAALDGSLDGSEGSREWLETNSDLLRSPGPDAAAPLQAAGDGTMSESQTLRDPGGTGGSGADPALDSGSAPLLAHPLTQTGAVMGTPAYMPPEQFGGEPADARSDQFSFCVALYEALYGERPFRATTLPELVGVVESGQVAAAPKGSAVPPWLRRVLVRGLQPDPDARWPDMDALLDALADDPRQRRRRWLRTAGLGTAAVLGGVLVARMTAPASIQLGELGALTDPRAQSLVCQDMARHLDGVWSEAERGRVREAVTRAELVYAEDTAERVVAALDDYTAAWVEARTEACVASATGEQSGALLDRRMACLDERLHQVDAMVEVFASADAGVVERANRAIAGLSRVADCGDREALSRVEAERGRVDDPAVAERVEALESRRIEAAVLRMTGRYEQGLRATEALVTEAEALGEARLEARLWLELGLQQARGAKPEEALDALTRAYREAVAERMPGTASRAATQIVFLHVEQLRQIDAAEAWLVHAEPLAEASGDPGRRADFHTSAGVVALRQGHYADAEAHHREAVALFGRERGEDSLAVADALINVAVAVDQRGGAQEARALQLRALAILEREFGTRHPRLITTLSNMGIVAKNLGDLAAAEGHYRQAIAIIEDNHGEEHWTLISPLVNYSTLSVLQGEPERAEQQARRALALIEGSYGPDHPIAAYALTGIGEALVAAGDGGAALEPLERALTLRTTHPGDPTDLAQTGFALAQALVLAGRGRSRAGSLAASARGAFEAAGEGSERQLEAVRAWQVETGLLDAAAPTGRPWSR